MGRFGQAKFVFTLARVDCPFIFGSEEFSETALVSNQRDIQVFNDQEVISFARVGNSFSNGKEELMPLAKK